MVSGITIANFFYIDFTNRIFQVTPSMASFRKLVIGSKALAFITLVSGAFVAGLDAGLVYNSFPKFADRWIPEDILAFSPTLRNITENPTTVQFNHRILGTSTLAALLLVAGRAQSLPLPPHLRLTALALGGMGCLQVAMGITTLLLYVPVPVAAAHQSGALVSKYNHMSSPSAMLLLMIQ